jgi:ketopantoate hydroxymethyltransferase
VLYDFLGLYGKKLKFVRVYKDLYSDIKNAVSQFIKDIGEEDFPSEKESFSL